MNDGSQLDRKTPVKLYPGDSFVCDGTRYTVLDVRNDPSYGGGIRYFLNHGTSWSLSYLQKKVTQDKVLLEKTYHIRNFIKESKKH